MWMWGVCTRPEQVLSKMSSNVQEAPQYGVGPRLGLHQLRGQPAPPYQPACLPRYQLPLGTVPGLLDFLPALLVLKPPQVQGLG